MIYSLSLLSNYIYSNFIPNHLQFSQQHVRYVLVIFKLGGRAKICSFDSVYFQLEMLLECFVKYFGNIINLQ